jgi:hypothetical protein
VTLKDEVQNAAASKELQLIAKAEPGVYDVEDQTTIEAASQAQPTRNVVPVSASAKPLPPPPPKPVVVPVGTVLTVRLGQNVGSKNSQAGTVFTATMANPVTINERWLFPNDRKQWA